MERGRCPTIAPERYSPADHHATYEEIMTARLEAARAAVFATVQMYAPVHAAFSAEATRQLTIALAEVEAAAIDSAKPGLPAVPPPQIGPAPDLVKFNEPTPAQPGAVSSMSLPDPVALAPPAPKAGKAKSK